MCLDIHANFAAIGPFGAEIWRGGQIDPPPPPPSKNLLSKSPVKIGLNFDLVFFVQGEVSFFLQPGESLAQGIQTNLDQFKPVWSCSS